MLSVRKPRDRDIGSRKNRSACFHHRRGDKSLSIVSTDLYRGTRISRTSTYIAAMRFYCAIIQSICGYIKRFCVYVYSPGHVCEYINTRNRTANDNS